MDDLDGKFRDPAVAVEFRLDTVLRTDQEHARAEMAGGRDRALNFGPRSTIRTHRIQGYGAWHGIAGKRLAGFFDFHNLAPFVVAALGAGAMGHLLLVAVGALRQRMLRQGIVRPSGGSPFL
jgi:hypothetical protein